MGTTRYAFVSLLTMWASATTSTVVDVYSTVTRVWSVGPPLSVARKDLAAAGAEDLVIFAGGRYVETCECSDLVRNLRIL